MTCGKKGHHHGSHLSVKEKKNRIKQSELPLKYCGKAKLDPSIRAARCRSRIQTSPFTCICIKLLTLYISARGLFGIHKQKRHVASGDPAPWKRTLGAPCYLGPWSGLGSHCSTHLSHLERKISTPAFYCQNDP